MPVLANLLALPDAHELFEWLRGLSFTGSTPLGLLRHSLVREAIASDLRWRNRERFAELHRRAREYYGQPLQETTGLEQQIVLYDYINLHRDNPVVKPASESKTASALPYDTPRTEDPPPLSPLPHTPLLPPPSPPRSALPHPHPPPPPPPPPPLPLSS